METLYTQEGQSPSEPGPRRGTWSEVEEIERIRWRVREKTDKGFAQSDIARKSGLSRATLNQFLNGKYEGRNWEVSQTLAAWLQAVDKDQRSQVSVPTTLVDTPTGLRIEHALAFAHTEPSIVIIYGNPGLGKTTSIARYQSAQVNVWTVTSNPASGGLSGTLKQVAGAVGLRGLPTTPDQLSLDIITRLRGTQGLLIVDEAQELSIQACNQLRAIFDAGGVGLALCGNEEVYSNITGRANRAYFAQLESRIGLRLKLQAPTIEDVDAFLAPWKITGGAEVEYARQVGTQRGGLRSLYQCLRAATMAAQASGQQLDVKTMRNAREALGHGGAQ